MAGAGTGLPSAQPGALTPVADTSTYGMAERAAADGFNRLRQSVDEGMQRWMQPALNDRAKALAAANAEAQQFEQRFVINPDDEAYNDAIRTAALASTRTSIEDMAETARLDHRYDPDGYQETMAIARSDLLQRVPGWMAVDVGAHFDGRAQAHLTQIRSERAQRDLVRSDADVAARVKRLDARLLNTAPDTIDFVIVSDERRQLQLQRSSNIASNYTPEQMANDDTDIMARAQVAAASRGAIAAAQAAGGGLPGQAAAFRFLDEAVLDNEHLGLLDPQVRAALWGLARQQVDIATRSDMEERRAQAEAERLRDQQARELMGERRLQIELGEISRAEVLADPILDDNQKSSLLRSIGERQRQEAREDRAMGLVVYSELSDQARSGGLTDGEIADHLRADNITDGQAGTLRRLRSTALRPIISNIMSPFEDAARRPGASLKPTAEMRARAEAEAATWAAANPESTLNDQLTFGRLIAERQFTNTSGGATTASSRTDQNARRAALSEERRRRQGTSNPMSAAEFERRRDEITNGR